MSLTSGLKHKRGIIYFEKSIIQKLFEMLFGEEEFNSRNLFISAEMESVLMYVSGLIVITVFPIITFRH